MAPEVRMVGWLWSITRLHLLQGHDRLPCRIYHLNVVAVMRIALLLVLPITLFAGGGCSHVAGQLVWACKLGTSVMEKLTTDNKMNPRSRSSCP